MKLVQGRKYLCQSREEMVWVTFTIVSETTCYTLDLLKYDIINVYDIQDRVKLVNERTLIHEQVSEDDLMLKMLCVSRDVELDFDRR